MDVSGRSALLFGVTTSNEYESAPEGSRGEEAWQGLGSAIDERVPRTTLIACGRSAL